MGSGSVKARRNSVERRPWRIRSLSTEVFTTSSDGSQTFLDLNGNGTRDDGEIVVGNVANTDTIDLDVNNDGQPTAGLLLSNAELQTDKSTETLSIAQSAVLLNNKITIAGRPYNVLTIGGERFIDLDGNGELTKDAASRPLEPNAGQLSKPSNDDIDRLISKAYAVDPGNFQAIAADIKVYDKKV